MRTKGNIYHLPDNLTGEKEHFETIAQTPETKLERIISTGQTTPAGQWYNQEKDEWVLLLKGNAAIEYEDGSVDEMKEGDYVLIPSGLKHRVIRTSADPPCIWLALHTLFY